MNFWGVKVNDFHLPVAFFIPKTEGYTPDYSDISEEEFQEESVNEK